MDESVDMEGKVIVLNHMSMKEEYWKPEYQLCLATGGFGCRPTASGRAVYATCLYDGDKARWNRKCSRRTKGRILAGLGKRKT